jgi:hypothetical protein
LEIIMSFAITTSGGATRAPIARTTTAVRFGLGGALCLLLSAWTSSAQAQAQTVCGSQIKEEVAKMLSAAAMGSEAAQTKTQADLYEKYKSCAQDALYVPGTDPFHVAARQCGAKPSYMGSTYYEEMSCCGYDPQRRAFACPVKIKQTFGFGGAPLPGSREFVQHCVADAFGVFQPVGHDSVHLANALPGNNPSWQFAVVANAVNNLQLVQPMNNQSRRARSILSWGFRPTGCAFQPVWGNVIDYQIRLDQ